MKSQHLLFVVILGVVLGACSTGTNATPTSTETLKVILDTEPNPPQIGEGHLIITIIDANRQPVDNVKVDVSMGMSSMSMDTQDGQADIDGKGHYVRAVTFHSDGQYTVRVWVRRAGQTLTVQDFKFRVS